MSAAIVAVERELVRIRGAREQAEKEHGQALERLTDAVRDCAFWAREVEETEAALAMLRETLSPARGVEA